MTSAIRIEGELRYPDTRAASRVLAAFEKSSALALERDDRALRAACSAQGDYDACVATLRALLELAAPASGGALIARFGDDAYVARVHAGGWFDEPVDALPAGAHARLGTLRFRAASSVHGACLSDDGTLVAGGTKDLSERGNVLAYALGFNRKKQHGGWSEAYVWRVSSGEELFRFGVREIELSAVAFSPDNTRLAACGGKHAALFDLTTGRAFPWRVVAKKWARSLAFAPDGARFVVGGDGRALTVWSGADGTEAGEIPVPGSTPFAFVRASGELATVSASYDVLELWDVRTCEPTRVVPLGVRCARLALSADGTRVAAASFDGFTVLDLASRTTSPVALPADVAAEKRVLDLALSRSGRLLSYVTEARARVLDLSTGADLPAPFLKTGLGTAPRFCDDETRMVRANWSGAPELVELPSGRSLSPGDGHPDAVRSVAFSPDGSHVVTCGWDYTARLWDARDGSPGPVLRGHTSPVDEAAFSRDGRLCATTSWDGTTRVWETATGRCVRVLDRGGMHGHVAFVPGADVLIVYAARFLAAYDPERGTMRWETAIETSIESAFDVSPDGRRVLATREIKVPAVFDAESGELSHTLAASGRHTGVGAFLPDGSVALVAGDEAAIQRFDARTGEALGTTELETRPGWTLRESGEDGAQVLAFSRDGRSVAGRAGRTVVVWDLASGRVAATRTGHRAWVTNAAFSPDGALLATASEDSTALLWERPA